MKKLIEVVNSLSNDEGKITDCQFEELVTVYVCTTPVSKTSEMYKNIISVALGNPDLLKSPKFKDILKSLEYCIPYADSDSYLDIKDTYEMVKFLRKIKNFNHEGVEFDFKEIINEIVEKEKVHKFIKLIDEVDKLMKSNIRIM